MALVKLTINGVEITEDDSLTILQAVKKHNLDDIPTLCYEERLGQITSCFMCVVEVEGARSLVPSCSTAIREGMSVRTRTEKVLEARRTCLELLFSDHYADCVSPCAMECPAGVDIQGYLSLVRRGLYREAVELIKEKNPLPIVCGRVCVRKCEVGCRRNILDEPVGINFLKRFAAESNEGSDFKPFQKEPKDKAIAIVGAGPAGLSAAYYLAVEGYEVTIFEAMPEAGGMLRYGIPPYRLPKDLLDREIDNIKDLGVKILTNKKMGADFTLTSLKADFDAVLLAAGAWGASRMRVENEDVPGVLSGLEVLRRTAGGLLKELKGRVLVVGGGNTAIDASRTAVRLGADETVILYRRTEAQMPAHHEEIEGAKQEGVKFKFLVAPTGVVTNSTGRVSGLECDRMELGPPDKSGRPRPVVIEGSRYVESADWIISAIGQSVDLKCLEGDGPCSLQLNRYGNVDVNPETMQTNIPGVFSAGDSVTGAATVIEGIAGGRRAAYAIIESLSGEKSPCSQKPLIIRRDMFGPVNLEDLSAFEHQKREVMPERPASERIGDFKQVELGLSKDAILRESCRCFECGCVEEENCILRKYGEKYGADPRRYLGEVNRYPVDRRHPQIMLDPNKCIQCGRCIETCRGILGGPALGFVNRGFKTIVAPAMEKPLTETSCIACGNCIDSCPTGAISENRPLMARAEGKISEGSGICQLCGAGCRVRIRSFGRDAQIQSDRDRFTGFGDYLCRKGRFGSSYFTSPDRILKPYIMEKGIRKQIPWDEAIDEIARAFKDIRDRRGDNSTALFLSPALSTEELYAGGVFARKILRTDLIGSATLMNSFSAVDQLSEMLGAGVSTISADYTEKADVILLFNTDPLVSHPTVGWKIRQGVRNGAKLIVINSSHTVAGKEAHMPIQPRRGTAGAVVKGILRLILDRKLWNDEFVNTRTVGLDELKKSLEGFSPEEVSAISGVSPDQLMDAALLIAGEDRKVIAFADPYRWSEEEPDALSSLAALLLITGNIGREGRGLILTEPFANSAGLLDAGARPGHLPGRVSLSDNSAGKRFEDLWQCVIPAESSFKGQSLASILKSGQIKGALILGEDPGTLTELAEGLLNLEFIAAADFFATPTLQLANAVLPLAAYAETGGSFISMDGRIQSFPPVIPPLTGKTNLDIFNELASAMGETFDFANQDCIREILSQKGEASLYSNIFATADGKARLICKEKTSGMPLKVEIPRWSLEYYCEKQIENPAGSCTAAI